MHKSKICAPILTRKNLLMELEYRAGSSYSVLHFICKFRFVHVYVDTIYILRQLTVYR